ncbi:transcription initiation protein [Mucilaginibacter sp. HMF5004]|uniref:YciI family protein n=1 Tax=Mucilaginibacter rivuli TaxID=2857527 RepID=UPI001C5CFF62|nr:YciI family protein [Mucilaginibacter rivuli]MBW4888295.1 transcription initiation protein [Mucilaginibacter rivuli]
MNEFAFIFRNDQDPDVKYSPEQMQGVLTQWRDWMGSIAAQNKLASPGNRLGFEAKVLKPNDVITDGPFVEMKEMLSGFIVVRTETIEEAVEFAKGCPVLKMNGSVEVRSIIPTAM